MVENTVAALLGKDFIFKGRMCHVTAVHSTHINFISQHIGKRGRLGRAYIEGELIKTFIRSAKPRCKSRTN
jgi:hypothetical protein